ncbi:MAG: hypothetical protein KDD58_01950 [Bdellovibrionales bacterium]|nr:hypothetical protein [Bdellovibrionales bacterium]
MSIYVSYYCIAYLQVDTQSDQFTKIKTKKEYNRLEEGIDLAEMAIMGNMNLIWPKLASVITVLILSINSFSAQAGPCLDALLKSENGTTTSNYIHAQLERYMARPEQSFTEVTYIGEAKSPSLFGQLIDQPARLYQLTLTASNRVFEVAIPVDETLDSAALSLLARFIHQQTESIIRKYKKYGFDISFLSSARLDSTFFAPDIRMQINLVNTEKREDLVAAINPKDGLLITNNLSDSHTGSRGEVADGFTEAHEIGHFALYTLVPKISNKGFSGSLNEGLADYFAWLVRGQTPEDKAMIKSIRGNVSFEEAVEIENGFTRNPHRSGSLISSIMIEFTEKLKQSQGEEAVFKFQNKLRKILLATNDDILVHGNNYNFHLFNTRVQEHLTGRELHIWRGTLTLKGIPSQFNLLPIVDDVNGLSSSKAIYPDYIKQVTNQVFTGQGVAFTDFKSYPINWSPKVAVEYAYFAITLSNRIHIDEQYHTWRIEQSNVATSQSTSVIRFILYNLVSHERKQSKLELHIHATDSVLEIDFISENSSPDLFEKKIRNLITSANEVRFNGSPF